ncbi:MAG: SDR family NAD(P)-dependent oxidoreductase [Hyphomonadaceae bacterium]|nr:SDR family NAD(P)-dependent oxidoreductase [Hyphomonadaceae bacterium]
MKRLDGLNALVTGGGKGIGAAIAAALTAEGAEVTVLGRDAAALQARVVAGDAVAAIVADVTDEAAVAAALSGTDGFSILVNNAGAASTAPFVRTGSEVFRAMFDVNLMGAVHLTSALLPIMVMRGFGRIVNVASTAGLKGYPYVSAYVSAKHALVGFTRSLALETATTGVTVNAVCPGFTDTGLVADSVARIVSKTGRTAEEARSTLASNNPQGRLIAPEEVADAVVFLAGATACAISGTTVTVAGGEI